jgi:hypothetical protein
VRKRKTRVTVTGERYKAKWMPTDYIKLKNLELFTHDHAEINMILSVNEE